MTVSFGAEEPGTEISSLPGQVCSRDPSSTYELFCGLRCAANLPRTIHLRNDSVGHLGNNRTLQRFCESRQSELWDCGWGGVLFNDFENEDLCFGGAQMCETTLFAPVGKRIRVFLDRLACRQYFYDGKDRSGRMLLLNSASAAFVSGRVVETSFNVLHFVYQALPVGFAQFHFLYEVID